MLLAKDWLTEKWQIVAISALIIVVVIVAIVYFNNLQAAKKLEAENLLNNASVKLMQQNYDGAINDLKNIVDNYSGAAAATAQFRLANAYYETREYAEARAQYEVYVNSYHNDKLTTSSAIAGIAACLENSQEFGSAGDKYLEAVEYYPDSPSAPDYYLGAVRCYTLGGDKEKAEKALAELESKFANTTYSRKAAMIIMGVES